jgi:hypothetical protein
MLLSDQRQPAMSGVCGVYSDQWGVTTDSLLSSCGGCSVCGQVVVLDGIIVLMVLSTQSSAYRLLRLLLSVAS